MDAHDLIDVCALGADRPDAAPFLWALKHLGATVATSPSPARVRVLFGPLVEDMLDGCTDAVFVPTIEEVRAPDPAWLDRPGLWIVPTAARAQQLARCASRELRILVLPWSHPEPVRFLDAMPRFDRPVIARGPRADCVSIPRRCDAEAVHETDDATLLIAPSTLATLMVAVHRGIPVFDFSDSPLADCIFARHHGALFRREAARSIVERLLGKPDQLRRLTCPQPDHLLARQQAFLRLIHDHVLGRPPTRVRFYHRPRSGQRRATGYRVKVVREFGIQPVWDAQPHTAFVLLGGRVPVDEVAQLAATTDRPIVLAMNDAITGPERLSWFQLVARHCQLMFVGDPPELLPPVRCPVIQLHAPPSIDGPHGSLCRPPEWPRAPVASGPDIVFLANTWYPRRVALVRTLAKHFRVRLYGRTAPPDIGGVRQEAHLDTADAQTVMRDAKITLSASIRNDRELTSNRLFNAAAVGACVLAEAFPNCRSLYPDDAVCWFEDPDDAVAKARELLDSDTREMRWRAQEITWQRHTGYARMRAILEHVEKHLGIRTLWLP